MDCLCNPSLLNNLHISLHPPSRFSSAACNLGFQSQRRASHLSSPHDDLAEKEYRTMSQYTASIPSDGQVRPKIQTVLGDFLNTTNRPDTHERYIDMFTKDAKITMGVNDFNGRNDNNWPNDSIGSNAGTESFDQKSKTSGMACGLRSPAVPTTQKRCLHSVRAPTILWRMARWNSNPKMGEKGRRTGELIVILPKLKGS